MLQEQRGDFVEIDYFSHCSPPYGRTKGICHAVGREGIPAAERIHINHGEPPKRGAACERSLLPAWKSAQAGGTGKERPDALLARRTRTMKLCSSDARSKGQPWPLLKREVERIGRASLDGRSWTSMGAIPKEKGKLAWREHEGAD